MTLRSMLNLAFNYILKYILQKEKLFTWCEQFPDSFSSNTDQSNEQYKHD